MFVHPLITTNVKLIVAVGDQKDGLEGSAVLPGTHRVHASPSSQSGHEGQVLVKTLEDTHQRVFVGDAGDAVLFDTKTCELRLANAALPVADTARHCHTPGHTVHGHTQAGQMREYFIIRYSPFTMRQAGALTEAIERLKARGGLDGASPELRQLLGVEPISGGENIYAVGEQ